MIGVVDYGVGNVRSVLNAIEHLGFSVQAISSPEDIDKCSHLILPGGGSFAYAKLRLDKLNLTAAIRDFAAKKKRPFLGICLGMQLLALRGYEEKVCDGLGLIDGTVRQIKPNCVSIRVPHIGWNEINKVKDSKIFKYESGHSFLYFNHSYALVPNDSKTVVALTDHGGNFVSAVELENVFGVQAHPEKSQRYGLSILENFIKL